MCTLVPAFAGDSFITSESRCDSDTLGSTETASVIAQWEANQYNVTYACGTGASGTPPAVDEATYDEVYEFLSNNSCAKPGYTFQGWSCPDIDNTTHTAGTTYTWKLTKGITCTAVFGENEINITWDGNGATTDATGGATTCTYDQSFNLPTPPTKTGYNFAGWKVKTGPAQCGTGIISTSVNGDDYMCKSTNYPNSGDTYNYSDKSGDMDSLSNGEWETRFPYGKVRGTSKCSATSGSYAVAGTPSDTNGKYCWCQVTSYAPTTREMCMFSSSSWVFYYDYDRADNCARKCASECADVVQRYSSFRSVVFGLSGN